MRSTPSRGSPCIRGGGAGADAPFLPNSITSNGTVGHPRNGTQRHGDCMRTDGHLYRLILPISIGDGSTPIESSPYPLERWNISSPPRIVSLSTQYRVAFMESTMSKLFEIPTTISVNVPKLGSAVSVSIPDDLDDDVVLHILQHGLKQKLVDSTAGINRAEYDSAEAYNEAVSAAVNNRMATLLTVPSERAFAARNPVETECRNFVVALLLKWKVAVKRSAAVEMASTYEKARLVFVATVGKAAAAKNPNAPADAIAAVVERQWQALVRAPAEKVVAERASAPADMGDLSV